QRHGEQPDHVRRAARRRRDAVDPGEGDAAHAAAGRPRAAVRARAHRVEQRPGDRGASRRGQPHQRPVLRVRRRTGAGRHRRAPEADHRRRSDWRQLCRPQRRQRGGETDRVEYPEARRWSSSEAGSLMFVDTFIRRPILATVCSLVIILAGVLAIPQMPIAQYPQVAPPTVNVTAVYTGANAETVETAVTTPLEQAINGVEGMLYMTSSSTNSGISQIVITFDTTRDPDIAAVDVQNRVNQALGRLPAEVRQLGVTVQKSATNFVMAAGAYAEQGEYDSLFLSNYIDVYIKDALKRVPG